MKTLILFVTVFFYGLPICLCQPGQPNPSFGNNGVLIDDGSRDYGIFRGFSIQKEKIIVMDLGFYTNDYIRRYNLNGTPDSTFGINGKTYISGNDGGVASTAIQQDGKIIVVRTNSIARFTMDGAPDEAFNGSAGERVIDPVSKYVDIRSVAIQNDGKIVTAGMLYSGGKYGFGVYRFNSNGSVDKSFARDGKQKTTFDSGYYAKSVVIQQDGKIVVGGDAHIVRYNSNGSSDKTFGMGGKLDIDFLLYKIALQNDGKLLAAGTAQHGSDLSDFVLARFNTDGSADNTFNGNGKKFTELQEDYGQDVALAIQNNGEILISGTVYHKGKTAIALARYHTNGSVDSSFGHNGLQKSTGLSGNEYQSSEMVILKDKAYVGGLFLPGIISYLLNESNATRVQFTEPFYSQASYTDPATIQIAVKVLNPPTGSGIKKVDFYRNNILQYTDYTSPYTCQLKNVHKGIYSIMAKATGNNGAVTTSVILPVQVLPNQPPYIDLNNPFYYGSVPTYYPPRLLAPATVSFSATAYDPDPDGFIKKVEFYDGATLQYIDSIRPYTFEWNNIPLGKHSVKAKAIDNSGLTTTYLYTLLFSVDTSIEPAVRISAPFSNQYFNGPLATVNISAEAFSMYPGGAISKVAFYNGAAFLGFDSTYPYNFSWTNVPLGTYLITAKATNSLGVSTTSAAVRIFVVTGQSPVVKITSPARDTNVITPDPILLTAEASDPYTFIKSVSFYNDSFLLFTESGAPYSRLWQPVATGSYHITAVATNTNGLKTTSAPVHITVLHNRPPVVNITSPADGATYTSPASITINAKATGHGLKIKSVEFYNGTTLLYTKDNFPYTFKWDSVVAGAYVITAKASDTRGRTTISSPVVITVTPPGSLMLNTGLSAAPFNTGINEAAGIKLLPNPVKNILHINMAKVRENTLTTISVVSSSGVIIKTVQASTSAQTAQINVSSLASGLYVIKIISGDKVMYKRFVKM